MPRKHQPVLLECHLEHELKKFLTSQGANVQGVKIEGVVRMHRESDDDKGVFDPLHPCVAYSTLRPKKKVRFLPNQFFKEHLGSWIREGAEKEGLLLSLFECLRSRWDPLPEEANISGPLAYCLRACADEQVRGSASIANLGAIGGAARNMDGYVITAT